MGHERRITMAKEVLKISLDKVVVDYDFRNDTDRDVTTEVAFPIPDYDFAIEQVDPKQQGFDDFKLWIDDVLTKSNIETRALVKGKDLTAILNKTRVDIGSFGHADDHRSEDIDRLNSQQRIQLKQAGLIDEDGTPLWTVRKKYYWQQTFPAHKTVHIRHEYTPADGATDSVKYGLVQGDKESAEELKSICVEGPLLRTMKQIANSKDLDAVYFYVDFILTTANTWKTPIEDFTLIVERPRPKAVSAVDKVLATDLGASYVSFCWDGPVTNFDADHFEAHATNYVPKKELRVGFFEVSKGNF